MKPLKLKDLNPQRRTAIVAKLTKAWDSLSSDHKRDAEQWYDFAHIHALEMGDKYAYSPDAIVGCIAWTSPGVRWATNLKDAEALARNVESTVTTYPNNAEHARNSLTFDGPDFGPYATKVRSFYSNIRDPKDSRAVTIDRWILRVLRLPESVRPKQYEWLAECFRIAADRLGLRPHVLQAGVWLAARSTVAGIAVTDPHLDPNDKTEVPF